MPQRQLPSTINDNQSRCEIHILMREFARSNRASPPDPFSSVVEGKRIASAALAHLYRKHSKRYQNTLPTDLLEEIYINGAIISLNGGDALRAVLPFAFLLEHFSRTPYFDNDDGSWPKENKLRFVDFMMDTLPGRKDFHDLVLHIRENIDRDLDPMYDLLPARKPKEGPHHNAHRHNGQALQAA